MHTPFCSIAGKLFQMNAKLSSSWCRPYIW